MAIGTTMTTDVVEYIAGDIMFIIVAFDALSLLILLLYFVGFHFSSWLFEETSASESFTVFTWTLSVSLRPFMESKRVTQTLIIYLYFLTINF